jgi:UDP-N-acetylmuramoyl-L-alanyl-D-glutamate--2,6-diaminopimelate ligase
MSELATSNQTPDDTEPRTVCVTGTNGKTTTTSMVEAIVAAAGEPSARITTLGSWVAGQLIAEDATSEAFSLTVRRAREVGVKTLAIETTSQALAEGFAAIWPADVGVFTNLSRDHLDYHGTPERYLAAKAQLFMHLREGGTAVLNAADGSSALLDEVTPPGVGRAPASLAERPAGRGAPRGDHDHPRAFSAGRGAVVLYHAPHRWRGPRRERPRRRPRRFVARLPAPCDRRRP